jgi:peptidoglycan/LPS O-acetylase OafA/YrhL
MRNYLPALDGVRAAAVLAVFTSHGSYGAVHGGFIGVEMFFALSGYLITTLLLAEYERRRRISIKRFYLRRASRLLPALALVTVLVLALYASDSTILPTSDVLTSIPKVWFYVGNWFVAANPNDLGLLGHTWSLAIEEQFYLLWPLALAFVLGRAVSVRRLIAGVLGLCAVSYLARYAIARRDFDAAYYRSDTRGGALLLGCGLALALTLPGIRNRMARLIGLRVAASAVAILAVCLLALEQYRLPAYAGGMFLIALATAVLIAHIVLHVSTLTPVGSSGGGLDRQALVRLVPVPLPDLRLLHRRPDRRRRAPR